MFSHFHVLFHNVRPWTQRQLQCSLAAFFEDIRRSRNPGNPRLRDFRNLLEKCRLAAFFLEFQRPGNPGNSRVRGSKNPNEKCSLAAFFLKIQRPGNRGNSRARGSQNIYEECRPALRPRLGKPWFFYITPGTLILTYACMAWSWPVSYSGSHQAFRNTTNPKSTLNKKTKHPKTLTYPPKNEKKHNHPKKNIKLRKIKKNMKNSKKKH